MANSKISALTDGNPAQSGDEIPIARGGANYKITAGSIASLSGNGDVVGPTSATDNAVARFDGTTGKLIQNSAITIEDDGSMVIPANSTNAGLRITQTGSGNALLVEDSTNPDATPFAINSDGRLIAGYTTAVTNVNTSTPQAQVHTAIASAVWSSLTSFNWSSSTQGGGLNMAKSRSGTIGTQSIVINGDLIGELGFYGDDGSTFIPAASIQAQVDGTPGTNDMPGRLTFSTTADGASSPTERMRIDSAGRVGIGGSSYAGVTLRAVKSITGSTFSTGILSDGTVQSDVTGAAFYFQAATTTAASAFTTTTIAGFLARQNTIGAGSTVTGQYGFFADSTLTGATNNYGFYSNISSGTGRWNFYANGTAENYLGGNLKIGGTAARATTAGTNQLVLFDGTAPVGTLTNGVSFYSASGEARVMDSAGNSTLLSPHDAETNEWIYHSVHTPTGKKLRIDMEKMMRFLNEHFGLDFIHEE